MTTGDTIAAISSATGAAARIIVRVGGADAWRIASGLAPGLPGEPNAARRVMLCFASLHVPAWAYVFRAPGSYTGEDLIELHIPGNPVLARLLLAELMSRGARPAEAGEFTARAYFNGRLDLTGAEGVAATIAAGSDAELRAARQLLAGELARRLRPVMDAIAQTLALVEVGIDFSDEDVSFIAPEVAEERIACAESDLVDLVAHSARFEQISHEPRFVLAGRPNAGKSTLLNALAGHERAVTSPSAGTTRDALVADVALRRGIVRVTDVAGLEDASTASIGSPQAGSTGSPQAASTGSPQAASIGSPQAGSTGSPQAGSTGSPQAGSTGSPQAGSTGSPQAGSTGSGQARLSEIEPRNALAEISRQMREQALRAVEAADRVVLVCDGTDVRPPLELPRSPDLTVITKADLLPSSVHSASQEPLSLLGTRHVIARVMTSDVCSPAGAADSSPGREPGVIDERSISPGGKEGQCPKGVNLFGSVFRPSGAGAGSSYPPGLRPGLLSTAPPGLRVPEDSVPELRVHLSAHTGFNLDVLRSTLDQLAFGGPAAGAALALNARHLREIDEAIAALRRAAGQVRQGLPELLALELREALDALGQIIGQIAPDDLLGKIFSSFCIGK